MKTFITILIFSTISSFGQTVNWLEFSPQNIGLSGPTLIRCIDNNNDSTIWFGTKDKGIIKYKNGVWSIIDSTNSPFKNYDTWALSHDSSNNLYLGTALDGLGILYVNGSWEFVDVTEFVKSDYNTVWEVEIDKADNIWIGTYWGGFAKFNGTEWTVYSSENTPMPQPMDEINALKEDQMGRIWFGTDAEGVGRFDGVSDWWIIVKIGWIVYDIEIEETGIVWFSGPKNQIVPTKVRRLNLDSTFTEFDIITPTWSNNALAIDNGNVKWFADQETQGLLRYDDQTFSSVVPPQYDSTWGEIWSVKIDQFNNKWIGYSNGYIAEYNENGINVTSVSEIPSAIPNNFQLFQNYPNPFNPTTKIKFTIPTVERFAESLKNNNERISNSLYNVQLKIYDVLGKEITTLVNEEKPVGTYKVEWDASRFPSGVYFYQLRASGFVSTKKMILLR